MTIRCLKALTDNLKQSKINTEIIVVDNHSTDNSLQQISNYQLLITNYKNVSLKIVRNQSNLGYSKANNIGLKQAKGKYILFLNSDVIIPSLSLRADPDVSRERRGNLILPLSLRAKRSNLVNSFLDFTQLINYLDSNPDIGVLTVRVEFSNGDLDPACHRGFPTLWRSFCYYTKLESVFRSTPMLNRIFGGYHLVNQDLKSIHEVDSPSGAFYLTRKKIVDQIGGFDEQFFMYGEDLDLSYRIKKSGFKIIFYPDQKVIHHKYQSGLNHASDKTRLQTKKHFHDAMKIFYDKNIAPNKSTVENKIVYMLIDMKAKL